MSTHLRTQIRTAVIERLRVSVPSVSGRVHPGARAMRQFQTHDIPVVLVDVAERGISVIGGVRPRPQRRPLSVIVEILGSVDTAGDIDEILDAIAVEVEGALAVPDFLPTPCNDWTLASTAMGAREGVDEVYASLRLTYAGTVTVREGAPTIPTSS